MHKIVFLYTEIAAYTLACLNALAKAERCQVYLFHYPINSEAPFDFEIDKRITTFEKSNFDANGLQNKLYEIKPSLIYVSGWIDQKYLNAIKGFAPDIPVVMGFDTPWNGTWQQHIKSKLFSYTIKKKFTHAFLASKKQHTFALKLGFKEQKILDGVYCCDVDKYNEAFTNCEIRPSNFIFIGRYVTQKNVSMLWQCFIRAVEELNSSAILLSVGVGSVDPVKHKSIKHLGFIQPQDMGEVLKQANVFILPSLFEPWGVVVQEMSCAGFPMILSNKVNAAEKFLTEENGFLINPNSENELTQVIKKCMQLDKQTIASMQKASHDLGNTYTPKNWAEQLLQLIE